MSIVYGLLNQKIDFIYDTTQDVYGDKTTEEIHSAVMCRWQEKINRVLNKDNEEVTTRIEVWLTSAYDAISYNWQFKKNGTIYVIQQYAKKYDLNGTLDHIKAYLS